jgi:hypothetical protein
MTAGFSFSEFLRTPGWLSEISAMMEPQAISKSEAKLIIKLLPYLDKAEMAVCEEDRLDQVQKSGVRKFLEIFYLEKWAVFFNKEGCGIFYPKFLIVLFKLGI